MKFKIRYADQIVGVSVLVAVVVLVVVIVLLGRNQRWFAKDYYFTTYLDSASGLSENMAIQYKGFTFGKVKSIKLTSDDRVEVRFFIQDTYIDRIKEGTLVALNTSPLASLMGSFFLIYPGRGMGPHLDENTEIYTTVSEEGKSIIARGLANIPAQDDSIGALLAQVSSLLTEINGIAATANVALKGAETGEQDRSTELGRLLGDVHGVVGMVNELPENIPGIVDPILEQILTEIRPLLADINVLTARIADEGLIPAVLDKEENVYGSLETLLASLSGILGDIDRTTDILPTQVAILLSEVQGTLQTADDVLTGVKNNPLLKKGIPDKVQAGSTGMSPRGNVSF
ncbi:MAG: MlaD family protein [Treponema sp.]|jgi:phospholipid/cholesterol/gamma-HCH transport system substrate-binding protein|nr:MlaD family protein [Treponema sp.]